MQAPHVQLRLAGNKNGSASQVYVSHLVCTTLGQPFLNGAPLLQLLVVVVLLLLLLLLLQVSDREYLSMHPSWGQQLQQAQAMAAAGNADDVLCRWGTPQQH
jgi:hypothetical protein